VAKTKATKPKAKPKSKKSIANKKKLPNVRIRMYQQGLGDCFLLTFPKAKGGDFHILIDCGIILGTPDANPKMEAVVEDILKTTSKRIDVLVVTHEHWDHVSGFVQAQTLFNQFTIDQVWLAWTEDPKDAIANQLRAERNQKLAELRLGLSQVYHSLLGADSLTDRVRDSINQSAEVLSFFGINPPKFRDPNVKTSKDEPGDPPLSGGLGATASGKQTTGAAMDWLKAKNPKFWRPGQMISLEDLDGVRIFVLGPPIDLKQLRKDLPTRSRKETYEEETPIGVSTDQTLYVTGMDDPTGKFTPFGSSFRISETDAQNIPFFEKNYYLSDPTDKADWRRIDHLGLSSIQEFALQLDSDTNNTSLVLAFQLSDGRVLLFPGDAQVGNWESWHADSKEVKRTWKVDGKDITAEQLLNNTVVYKVGHHGSHNATLRALGLELMTHKDLVALVPVDEYIAHEKKGWKRMPFNPLIHRLSEVTQKRIVQVDRSPSKDLFQSSGVEIEESTKQLNVLNESGNPSQRPLYIDILLPLNRS
jgi:beta-lactamase superfamily II metal-dependent hydrolase